jgi:hypothetical protein
MIVKNEKACVLVFGSVMLIPGNNFVDDKVREYLMTDASFKEKVSLKILNVVDEQGSDTSMVDDEAKAVAVVKSTYDRSTLKKLSKTETRATVQAAIAEQGTELSRSDR